MKISINSHCPCGSKIKYKKCCQPYHKGKVAENALVLMKSRYSAYSVHNANYIIKTTHIKNSDYTSRTKEWYDDIEYFCNNTQFLSLEILEFIDGENEAYVSFKAKLSSGDMVEKSRFLKVNNQWLYIDGEFR